VSGRDQAPPGLGGNEDSDLARQMGDDLIASERVMEGKQPLPSRNESATSGPQTSEPPVEPDLEIPTLSAPHPDTPPEDSVLDDITTEFGRHTFSVFDHLVDGLRRSMFVDRQTAIVFALSFVFAFGGAALWNEVVACACDEPRPTAQATGRPAAVIPDATPTLVRLEFAVVAVPTWRAGDADCDPYLVRFRVRDQSLAGRSVVLELITSPIEDAMKPPKRTAPPQRVEGVIRADGPIIETPVYAFTSADVRAVSIDGKPATGSTGFGNKGHALCQ
jgi:hypothetical protein